MLVARSLALVSALASLTGLWFSERARVRDDLQLSAEAVARPGDTIALRAFYLKDVEAPAGPTLATTTAVVRLLDAHERELGRASLRAAQGDTSMEGSMRIPSTARGGLVLEAEAQLGNETPLRCRRNLEVSETAPSLVPRPREAPPLQQLALGPAKVLGPLTDIVLLPKVVGGSCVPEQRCTVLVWVGGTGAQVTVRHDASVTLDALTPQEPTRGFAEAQLTVHGPEATIVFEARREGQLVLERSVRLPIGLGEARIALPSSLVTGPQPVSVRVTPAAGRSAGIVDVFAQGRWRASEAFIAQPSATLTLPAELLGQGLVRIQAHSDRFTGEGAAARLLYVRGPTESSAVSFQNIVSALRAAGLDPAPMEELSVQPSAEQVEPMVAFLLAGLEGLRVPLPRAVSARPAQLHRLSKAQTALRYLVGGVLVASALIVGMTLMRRGLAAHSEAQQILAEAAQEAGQGRNIKRASGVYFVVWLVLAVGLAFLVAALLIVAKPLWF